ncbi:MAG: hypothetical protein WBA57_27135 [Elainellaceae cyanobacterium]
MALAPVLRRFQFRPRLTTLILVGVLLLSGAIATAWFARNGTITAIFQRGDRPNRRLPHPPDSVSALYPRAV